MSSDNEEVATGIASEGGHWYARDGSAVYQVPNKSKPGEMRDTTLRDAKRLGLVPSVTEIMKVEAKPALVAWQIEQAFLACLTLPRVKGETLDELKQRATNDANAQAELAKAKGQVLHAEIERYIVDGRVENPDTLKYVVPVADWLDRNFGRLYWRPEKSFAHPLGFGGKVDLHCSEGEFVVLDFKTKDFGPEDAGKKMAWDNHAMQLHAYAHGLDIPSARKLNLFVSTRVPGLLVWHEWHADSDYQWTVFKHLLEVWKLRKKYNPEFTR